MQRHLASFNNFQLEFTQPQILIQNSGQADILCWGDLIDVGNASPLIVLRVRRQFKQKNTRKGPARPKQS